MECDTARYLYRGHYQAKWCVRMSHNGNYYVKMTFIPHSQFHELATCGAGHQLAPCWTISAQLFQTQQKKSQCFQYACVFIVYADGMGAIVPHDSCYATCMWQCTYIRGVGVSATSWFNCRSVLWHGYQSVTSVQQFTRAPNDMSNNYIRTLWLAFAWCYLILGLYFPNDTSPYLVMYCFRIPTGVWVSKQT